ncbi:MAG: sulfatase-like hydrolase/transferase, partial [Gemmatimonadetes bacterium]|nr:sulfatase-like hydrolase/transferase [Gemmatimonadota bacterium]
PGTLWVVTGDHGEELYERNRYVSHSASIYDGVLRAPLLFVWPGRIPAGAWRSDLAEAVDIAPTVLRLCGVDAPASFHGRDLGPERGDFAEGADAEAAVADAAVAELEDRVLSLRTSRYRYVSNPDGFHFPLSDDPAAARYVIAREELYDLEADPGERINIAGSRPDVAARFREAADRWRRAHGWEEASRRFRKEAVPEELKEELDALGYLN